MTGSGSGMHSPKVMVMRIALHLIPQSGGAPSASSAIRQKSMLLKHALFSTLLATAGTTRSGSREVCEVRSRLAQRLLSLVNVVENNVTL